MVALYFTDFWQYSANFIDHVHCAMVAKIYVFGNL